MHEIQLQRHTEGRIQERQWPPWQIIHVVFSPFSDNLFLLVRMYYLTADICVFPETQKCILHSSVDHKLSKGTKSVRVNLELMSMK